MRAWALAEARVVWPAKDPADDQGSPAFDFNKGSNEQVEVDEDGSVFEEELHVSDRS